MKKQHLPRLQWPASCLLVALTWFSFLPVQAQQHPPQESTTGKKIAVTGKVTDAANHPMPGVTVLQKGTQNGIVTDAAGNYRLQVPADAVLLFSIIGMDTKEIPVNGRTQLSVALSEKSTSLNEVVAIGYGKQSRATLTTAISRVNSKEFEHAPGQNPLLQMQGKVPGLTLQVNSGQPGADPQIFLRGGTTSSPEKDAPLLIIDGMVSQGMRSISDMNADDIESVQVLKDAASTAIYGARAANGIIIIKTKSGKAGKPRVSFGFNYGLEQQAKQYKFLNARDYIYVSRKNTMDYNKTNPDFYLTGGRYGMSTGNPRNSKNTLEFLDTYVQNYGQAYVDHLLQEEGWETMTDPVTNKQLLFKGTDYQDVTFQNGTKKQYDVSVSGGSDKGTYYLGLGHSNQDGIITGTFYKNYNGLFNGTYKISDKWSFNTNIGYSVRYMNSPNNDINVLSRSVTMPPTYRLYYEDGTPAPGEGVTSFRSRLHEVYYKERYTDIKVYRTTFQLGVDWDILPGLRFSPSFAWFTTEGKENRFEAFNETNPNRNASAAHNLNRHTQADAVLNYDKTIGSKHHFNAMAGTSYINDYDYNMSGSGYGAPNDNIPTLNATKVETQRTSTSMSTEILMSYFGRLNYDFDNKYLFSASIRSDGSSRFSGNHRWAAFPGVSAGWNLHHENFWASLQPVVSQLKIRGSWGQAGNNALSIFDSQGQYSPSLNGNLLSYMGNTGILNTVLPNNDLVWETTTSVDAGLDIGLFKDRITILLDFYNKITDNRLFDKPLDATTGFSKIRSNYGTIRNRGIEIELNATPVKSREFTWNTGITFAFNRGTVVSLPANGEAKNRIGGNYIFDPNSGQYVKVGGLAEGERFGGRWAYQLDGVYASDKDAANAPRDIEANGRKKTGGDAIWHDFDRNDTIDYRDMTFMGYIRPDKQGAIVNTLTYKGISLRIVADYALGHVIDNGFRGKANGSSRNNNQALTDVTGNDIWKKDGDQASIPKYTVQSDYDYNFKNHNRASNGLGNDGTASNSSLYYKKGDYLALREISLSYSIRAALLQKASISSIDVFGGVYNICYFTKYDGLSPEVFTGVDPGLYPRPRQYNFGVKVNF
ncbi:SusC/RagA family TonB-linked outer membrane protein [Chitinophaga qingshengii]|uniref:TonB-dependent receptor n=1 Tax=Chitinophaga qingshengii TaxID=1569794 RepID=A0ABR7TTY6_9BACT|nr:TonB-dependent receptor [Chitinophaga qingshengii]MBC9933088.1 TonB-dependent receptor [Chitinophaga qingshengii]